MVQLSWGPLGPQDLDDLAGLARVCLAVDGGLPSLAEPATLHALFLTERSIGGRDETGELVVAAGLAHRPNRVEVIALVAPGMRGTGAGRQIVEWVRTHARRLPIHVIDEALSSGAEETYAEAGLRLARAEIVMRHPLTDIPRIPRHAGLQSHPFSAATARVFFAAYQHSFGDQQGFPDPDEQEWLAWLTGDPGFRPDDSRVVVDPAAGGAPVGFVTLSADWLEQVGVVPAWRGRGLGAHLVVRSLTALARSGATQAWLEVNADNPSRRLYARLGFIDAGTRARYTIG